MEGAVRSGQLAVASLLSGKASAPNAWAFRQVAYSGWSLFARS
jgi:hypothetical protein